MDLENVFSKNNTTHFSFGFAIDFNITKLL